MKLAIGFIVYGETTAKYLPYFLPSLKAQTFKGAEIFVLDNSDEKNNENAAHLVARYPEIHYEWPGSNLGFARGFNRLIRLSKIIGAEYFLALNPDMILEPEAAARLVAAMDRDPELGSACPKILRWDFANSRMTDIIDSCGIVLKPGLRFIDLGQDEKDNGRCANTTIIGSSGAAAIYRLSALEKVKTGEEYFDERMFMYKEDCDMAYRLYFAGFKSKCVCEAVVYHDRSVGGAGTSNLRVALNRAGKSRQAKEWSFLNQHIIFLKHWHTLDFLNKLVVIWHAVKMLIFALLFERYLLKQYRELRKLDIRN